MTAKDTLSDERIPDKLRALSDAMLSPEKRAELEASWQVVIEWAKSVFSTSADHAPTTVAEKLAAIDAAEQANRRNLEMLGMDPSRATELANAQRSDLKEARE